MSGVYSLISAGRALERQLDTSSNNLANVNTAGFKEDQLSFRELLSTAERVAPESTEERFLNHEYLDMYVGMDRSSVGVDQVGMNFSEGPMRSTDNPLDLALEVGGFFSVQTPQGERFTRAGQFQIDGQSRLVDKQGFALLGDTGNPITIQGKDIQVDANGRVEVDGQFVDRIKTVRFRDPAALQKLGANFFAPMGQENAPIVTDAVEVKQGMVEESNVSTVKEMVRMINANRTYESVMRSMKGMDAIDEKSITLARV